MGDVSLISLNVGRPRLPTATKELQKTARPNRTNEREPKGIAAKMPAPPEHFTERQKETWAELAGIVDPMRIATASDVVAFEFLVVVVAILREADRSLWDREKNPKQEVTYELKNGARKRRPEIDVINLYKKLFDVAASRFGIAPADRARVSELESDVAGKGDSLDEFASP